MSFFIGGVNFLAGIDLFKVKPDYQIRDRIETKISAILPFKHTINVEGSNIKVEVFHSDVTDEQLAKIETVINDTFKVCQKYKLVPSNTDFNFRMFLFEDREQYINARKDLHGKKEEDISSEAGVTVLTQGANALSDVLMYRESDDKFPFESDSFDKIDYYTLSHEFVHCLQKMAQHKDAFLNKPVLEGSANSIACEALQEKWRCEVLENIGSCKIKSHDLNLRDVYYAKSSIVNEDPYTTGMAMFKFLAEKHPEIINDIPEYFMSGDDVKWRDIFNKIWDIDNKNPEEFKEWIDNQDTQYTKCDSSMDIVHGLTSLLIDIL